MKIKPTRMKCRKIGYSSAKDAYRVKRLMAEGKRPRTAGLHAYLCPYCKDLAPRDQNEAT